MIDRNEIFNTIKNEVNEQRTDLLIDVVIEFLFPKLPNWLGWTKSFVRTALDKAMPRLAHWLLYILVFGERPENQVVKTPPFPKV